MGWRSDKNKDANATIHATVFDSSDGVRSLEDNGGYTPHVAKSADGKIWFLPSDGVSVVDPRHLPFNRLPPPVHIEQISADRKVYALASDGGGQLRLPALVRDLQINYTALSLLAPEKVLFRYKLEGWDRDWIDAGNRRQAFYSNLPPNNYRFRVMACNNSGVERGRRMLRFSISSAYYQTAWFRVVVAAPSRQCWLRCIKCVRYLRQQFNVRWKAVLRRKGLPEIYDTFLQSVRDSS